MAFTFVCPRCGREKKTRERQIMADPPKCDHCKDEILGRKVPVYMRPKSVESGADRQKGR